MEIRRLCLKLIEKKWPNNLTNEKVITTKKTLNIEYHGLNPKTILFVDWSFTYFYVGSCEGRGSHPRGLMKLFHV